MSTNNFRTTSISNSTRGGLKPILTNKNISNIQASKNAINRPILGSKKVALSSSTNLVNNNSKLDSKSSLNNPVKKPLVSITENENADVKNDNKLQARKSKIPKFSSPAKPARSVKQFKKDVSSTIKPAGSNEDAQSKLNAKLLLKESNLIKEEENTIKFSSFKIPDNVEDIDINDYTSVLLAPGFSNDIYVYLNHLEGKFKIKNNFLQIQQQMNHKMRARLVDWIIAVHHKFKLLPETLYLAVAIMDRFLEKVNVVKDKVQLVGVTAFFIACKYEEIYPPEITDFIKVCDAYNKNEILKMEKTILKTLNFVLSYPLPLHFLRRFSKAANADQEIHTLAKYLMELSLVEYECSSWKPSLIAAASLYLTLHILAGDSKTQWTDTLAFYTNYKEDELQKEASYLSKLLLKQNDSKLQTTKNKYSNSKLLRISENPKLNSEYVVKMAKKFD